MVNFVVVFAVYLSVICQINLVISCDLKEPCPGDRPRSEDDCCPLTSGQACGLTTSGKCDTDLGYHCKAGICRGTYNLTVSAIDATFVTLTWSAFLPPSDNIEYSVLFTTVLTTPILEWTYRAVGNEPSVRLRDLTPATWYYVRIGVWQNGVYVNLTEIAMFQTKAKEYCLYNGRQIPVGERLVVECEESCVCLPTGTFGCIPVCPKYDDESPRCDVVDDQRPRFCCEQLRHCSYDNCTYQDESMQHERTWRIDCTENCTCYDGVVTCTPLCEEPVRPDKCRNPKLTKDDDGCCATWVCFDNGETSCTYGNDSYTDDEWFFQDDCQLCTCSQRSRDCIHFDKCGDAQLPVPSVTCQNPVTVNNSCCEQVVCQNGSDSDGVIDLLTITELTKSSFLIRFRLASNIDDQLLKQLVFYYTTNQSLSEFNNWENLTYTQSDVIYLNTSSKFEKVLVLNKLYKIDKIIIFSVRNINIGMFYYMNLRLDFKTNSLFHNEPSSESVYSDTIVFKIKGTLATSPHKISGQTGHHESGLMFKVSNIQSSSVLLTWNVSSPQKRDIASFVIKYKTFGDIDWQLTKHIIFSDNSYVLTCLHHSRWYEAQLVASPSNSCLGTIVFNTSALLEYPNDVFSTTIYDVDIGQNDVTLHWHKILLTQDVHADEIMNIEIVWTHDTMSNDRIWKACTDADTTSYKLDNLLSATVYIVWVGVYMTSGRTSYSDRLHFVTLTDTSADSIRHTSPNHTLVIAVTISCISMATLVIAVVTVLYLTRCRRRSSYQTQSSFENRIFQIYSQKDDREL